MDVDGNWFKDWFNSPYYHLLYFNRDDQEAATFIDALLDHLNPPPGAFMLDIGCGKGRHSKILAARGYDVTGTDISFENIQSAREFESERLHFFQHDMRLPFQINYYDYAFNFFTSFGYFNTEREHYNTVRSIAQSLKKGGFLALDYLNVHYAEDNLVAVSEKKIGNVNFVITKWMDDTHFFKKIMVEDEQLSAPLVFVEKVAKLSLGDFNDMFAYHGLQIQEVFGDYHFGGYDVKRSPRLIMIAKK